MDGGFYLRSERVVHLWVHNLSDDPVHTRLQHARPIKNKKRTWVMLNIFYIFGKQLTAQVYLTWFCMASVRT